VEWILRNLLTTLSRAFGELSNEPTRMLTSIFNGITDLIEHHRHEPRDEASETLTVNVYEPPPDPIPPNHPVQPVHSTVLSDASATSAELTMLFEYHTEPYCVVTGVRRQLQTKVIDTTKSTVFPLYLSDKFDKVNVQKWGTRAPALGSTREFVSVYVNVPVMLPVCKSFSASPYNGTTWSSLSAGDTVSDMPAGIAAGQRDLDTHLIPVQGTVGTTVEERTQAVIDLSEDSLHRIDETFLHGLAIVTDTILTEAGLVPGAIAQAAVNVSRDYLLSISHKAAGAVSGPHNMSIKNGYTPRS